MINPIEMPPIFAAPASERASDLLSDTLSFLQGGGQTGPREAGGNSRSIAATVLRATPFATFAGQR
ncbi:MAG: hypothetical protein KDI82_07945, partial [Gammaproteobacteria bacterium]|nr:hypothetical protein [Gammaproteobacteria bacterium]